VFGTAKSKACAFVAAALMLMAGADAHGASKEDTYPSRPIKVIVPFGAGGGSDTFVRIIQKAIEDNKLLPQPLVVINVPGAGGTIGSQRATNAEPDGYTILNLHQGILTAKYSGKVDHGPEAFEPIIATGEDAMILAVADDSEFTTLRELLDTAKATPDTIAYGANLGAPSHFSGLLLERAHPGARFRFVQTGGGAKRFSELTGGHIAMTTFSVSEYLRFRSGGIRALVFLGPKRHPALPDTPTAREQKFDVTTSNLQFWWAPKGTPPDRVQFLADAFERAMNTDYVQEKLASMHVSPVIYKDERLLEVIAEREAAIAKVDTRKLENLPNLPAIVMAIVALLLIAVVVTETRNRSSSNSPSATPAGLGPIHAWNRYTTIAFLTPLAYVLLLSLKILPFAAVTALFIFGLGLCLERLRSASAKPAGESKTHSATLVIQLAALAIITGMGSYLVFTRVFTIDLP
jgi:tripartite-type tricarboxylate transporter receptor subunit TctC